jgi:hypothetical protein
VIYADHRLIYLSNLTPITQIAIGLSAITATAGFPYRAEMPITD